jgi:uncharacterized membrane protein HdeD (DUF308 family)
MEQDELNKKTWKNQSIIWKVETIFTGSLILFGVVAFFTKSVSFPVASGFCGGIYAIYKGLNTTNFNIKKKTVRSK